MIKSKSSTATRNSNKFRSSATYFSALVLLVLSGLFLGLDSLELPTDERIFYWSLGLNLLFWGKCLTVPLALACAFLWARRYDEHIVNWKAVTSLLIFIALFLVLAWAHYVFVWAGSSLANVGTANFAGNTYHLARRVQFDESDRFYLGVCAPTQFQCNFHEIFAVNSHSHPKTISLKVDQQSLSILVDSELVYTYDGFRESCINRDLVYCR